VGDVTEGDLEGIFNSISSNILKWLRFKLLRWMHYLHHSAMLNNRLGLFRFLGFPRLHHIPSQLILPWRGM
jgi:hypothetical protein